MKVINIEVNNIMRFDSIYDSDNQSSQSITAGLKIPAGNYNDILLNFNFISPDATQEGLHLFATFKRELVDEPVEVEIASNVINNTTYAKSCYIPFEMLQNIDKVAIGVYGYTLNSDETLNRRISLTPLAFLVIKGSYNEDDFIEITPTPTVFEIYFDKIDNAYTKFSTDLQNVKSELETDIQTNVNNEATARSNADTVLQNNIDSEATSRTNADTNLQNQITNGLSKISNGTPLVASSTSVMTDTTRIYVNTSDGHWYYYNGSAWADGGVYQATELEDYSINNIKINTSAVTIDKINDYENILYKAIEIMKNKRITGYDNTTFLPTYQDNSNSTVYIFNTSDIDAVLFYANSSSQQAYVFYTEDTGAHNTSYSSVINDTTGAYDSNTNEYALLNQFIPNYEKVAVCLNNNYLYAKKIKTSNYLDHKSKDIVGKIYINQIENEKVNLLSDAIITNAKACVGYDTTSFIPKLRACAKSYSADILLNISSDYLTHVYYKVPDFTDITYNVQALVLYTENTKVVNYTYSALIASTYYDSTTGYIDLTSFLSSKGLYLSSYEHLLVICDYNDDLPIYSDLEEINKVQCILNDKFKVVKNNKLLFFHQNFTKNINTNYANLILSPNFKYNFKNCLVYESASITNTNHNINYYLESDSSIDVSKKINIEVLDENVGENLTKKVMFIGDSLTDQNVYPTKVEELFEDDVMNIELIGTLDNNMNEGRSGWRAYTYCNCSQGSDESTASGFYQGTNAFWNPDTNEFDFSYYMSTNNFSNVDYVFINLGTNDLVRGNYKTESEIVGYYNTMINSIKLFDSNIKIGLWLPPARGIGNNVKTLLNVDSALVMNQYLINNFEGQEDNNIYLIPINVAIDPDNDYNTNNYAIDDTQTISYITDTVHPKSSGYNKIAYVIYYWIKYFGSLDD